MAVPSGAGAAAAAAPAHHPAFHGRDHRHAGQRRAPDAARAPAAGVTSQLMEMGRTCPGCAVVTWWPAAPVSWWPGAERTAGRGQGERPVRRPRQGWRAATAMGEVLRVSADSKPKAVAGALAAVLRERGAVELQAVGAGAVNQAVKAIAICRGFVAPNGIRS